MASPMHFPSRLLPAVFLTTRSPFLALRIVGLLCLLVFAPGCDRNEDNTKGSSVTQPLPILSKVPEFSLTDQDGRAFSSNSLKGKPYLVAFFFTRCPSICPEVMRRMRAVHAAVKPEHLQFVAISVDPENDTPDVLKAYAKKHGAAHSNWTFLTGEYEQIAHTSEEAFKVGLEGSLDEQKPHFGITHGSHFVLVDGSGQIRGYYRSSEDEASEKILAALLQL